MKLIGFDMPSSEARSLQMSKYELIDSKSDGFFDAFIEIDFAKPLNAAQIVQVIKLIADVMTTDIANQVCEGISCLQVTETDITIQLRHTTAKNPQHKRNVATETRAQFMFYLFAKIDSLFPLNDVPLPDGWQGWLNFPEYIEQYGY